MLTENRKRRRGNDGEEDSDPRAKRGGPDALETELGRDAWDSEQSSSSESSGVASSPERPAPCPHASHASCNYVSQNPLCPPPDDARGSSLHGLHGDTSYDHINRVLREAHFSSLQTRAVTSDP